MADRHQQRETREQANQRLRAEVFPHDAARRSTDSFVASERWWSPDQYSWQCLLDDAGDPYSPQSKRAVFTMKDSPFTKKLESELHSFCQPWQQSRMARFVKGQKTPGH